MNTHVIITTLILAAAGGAAACGGTAQTDVDPSANGTADRNQRSGSKTKPLTCSGWIDCVADCTRGDYACVEACDHQTAEDEQAKVQDLISCQQQYGCEDRACLDNYCGAEMFACFPDEAPPQQLSCSEWFECAEPCDAFDDACFDDCTGALSAKGREELDALAECVSRTNCEADECQYRCRSQIDACFH